MRYPSSQDLVEWRFGQGDGPDWEHPGLDDTGWSTVAVPHDWSIEEEFASTNLSGPRGGYAGTGVGWYRTQIEPPRDDERVRVEFDGVYMDSTVYFGGRRIGGRHWGYASFSVDLPDTWTSEEGVLAVRVDNSVQPGSRWYTGSGLIRGVRVVRTGGARFRPDSVTVATQIVDEQKAGVRIGLTVENHGDHAVQAEVSVDVLTARGGSVVQVASPVDVAAGASTQVEYETEVEDPQLWDLSDPHLYRVDARLRVDDEDQDRQMLRFGIRSVAVDPDKGLLLNGKHVPLRGMCLHGDCGALGAAFHPAHKRRQLERLIAMGCNAVRMTHYPAAPAMLDLCDELGVLVVAEAFDEWENAKAPGVFAAGTRIMRSPILGYHRFFPTDSESDLRMLLRRDRHHPSIIMWSIGNEISDTLEPRGATTARRLTRICREEDPTRPVTLAMNGAPGTWAEGVAESVDVVGYNYKEIYYESEHAEHPTWCLLGTEVRSGSPFAGRGDYANFVETAPAGDEDVTWTGRLPGSDMAKDGSPVSNAVAQRLLEAEESLKIMDDADYLIGQFGWTGADYLGEPTPFSWPSKSSYFGVMDLCGFPKDVYFLYKSVWTSEPVVHLLPHWNWPDRQGERVPVWCYTTGDRAELFLNGVSLGVRRKSDTPRLHLSWDVAYRPGTLRVVAWRGDDLIGEQTVSTAGPAHALKIEIDEGLAAHHDVLFCEVSAVDQQGRHVPTAGNTLRFEAVGAGDIVAVDNGDPASTESFTGPTRSLYNGRALGVVRLTRAGELRVGVTSPGLVPARSTVQSTIT